jgi:hypothetical protein
MPTLDAPKLWRPVPPDNGAGTDTDWPILMTAVLSTDADDRPTSNESFSFVAVMPVESDSRRVRRAVRRAVEEFGPAFDRLGSA